MDFDGFPFIVGWELTLACNLRCRHCGSSAGASRHRELSLEEILAICDQLPNLLVYEVDFTGGEPLLRPDWWRITEHLRDLEIKAKIITNGFLLGEDTVAKLSDTGVACVGISIDGLEDTHDYIRACPGLFRRALAGIERVRRAGIPVTVITTVNALNVDQLSSLHVLLQSLDVDNWQFQPIFPLGRAQHRSELMLSEKAYMQLGDFARDEVSLNRRERPVLLPGDSFGYYTDMDQRQPAWGGCSAGLFLCGITSDGRVKGCLSMPDELSEGDLRQRDLWDIWFDPATFGYNRKFTLADLGSNCHSCDLAEKCQGGCSSMSYACTGKLHNDPYCFSSIRQKRLEKGSRRQNVSEGVWKADQASP
jgi:radical SAM protein with 4Fe4S-binding SPASM domain